ncbi:TPA: phage tail protein [Escherichia coli]|nr:phage tail protein [Escherichia coli]HBJ1400559.1 phage tail protein [Escherichia coli]
MAINNFKPFALDPNANVTSQADWEALPALLSGFTAGKASSAQVNKAIRQASFIAAALAQYTANKSGLDVLDDGDLNGFISKMGTAFGKDFQALDATLSALAGLATGANKLPYFTGNDTAAQTDLTSVGRDIIGKNTIADILTYLGFGERLLEADGYFELPGGLLLQWGHGSVQATNATVRFKKPFNVTPFIVLPHKITANGRYVTSANYTLTSFSLYGWNGNGAASNIDSYTYFALGI